MFGWTAGPAFVVCAAAHSPSCHSSRLRLVAGSAWCPHAGFVLACSTFPTGPGVKVELGCSHDAWDTHYRSRFVDDEATRRRKRKASLRETERALGSATHHSIEGPGRKKGSKRRLLQAAAAAAVAGGGAPPMGMPTVGQVHAMNAHAMHAVRIVRAEQVRHRDQLGHGHAGGGRLGRRRLEPDRDGAAGARVRSKMISKCHQNIKICFDSK